MTRGMIVTGLLVFLVALVGSFGKPLTTDEADHSAMSEGISQTGKPFFHYGIVNKKLYRDSVHGDEWIYEKVPGSNEGYSVVHTLFYNYLLGFFYLLFGVSLWVSRLPGALCVLINAFLIWKILRDHFEKQRADEIFGYASLLFLINPFIVQMGLMVDTDNTVLSVCCLWFLREYSRRDVTKLFSILYLSFIFVLTNWCKEYGGFYLFVSVFVFEVLRYKWKNALAAVGIFALGMAAFVGSWVIYTSVLDLPADQLWHYNVIRPRGGLNFFNGGFLAQFSRIKFTFLNSFAWHSVLLFLIFVLAIGARVKSWTKEKSPLDLLFIFTLVFLAVTKIARPNVWSLKYEYPAYPPMILVISVFLHSHLSEFWNDKLKKNFVLFVVFLIPVLTILQGDPVLNFMGREPDNILKGSASVLTIPIAIALILLVLLFFRKVSKSSALATIVSAVVAANLSLILLQLRPYITNPTWPVVYGEMGLEQIQNYLAAEIKPGELGVLRRDIAIELRRRTPGFEWINTEFLSETHNGDQLLKELAGANFVAMDFFSITPDNMATLLREFELVADFEKVFFVLKRKKN